MLQISSNRLHVQPHQLLIQYNTARLLHKEIYTYIFLRQFFDLNKEIFLIYSHLENYEHKNYRQRTCLGHYGTELDKFHRFMDKLLEFELCKNSVEKEEELEEKAVSLFENKDVVSVASVDMIEIQRLNLIKEYCQDIHVLMNAIEGLDLYGSSRVTSELKVQLEEILKNKGLDQFQIPEELLIKTENQ